MIKNKKIFSIINLFHQYINWLFRWISNLLTVFTAQNKQNFGSSPSEKTVDQLVIKIYYGIYLNFLVRNDISIFSISQIPFFLRLMIAVYKTAWNPSMLLNTHKTYMNLLIII